MKLLIKIPSLNDISTGVEEIYISTLLEMLERKNKLTVLERKGRTSPRDIKTNSLESDIISLILDLTKLSYQSGKYEYQELYSQQGFSIDHISQLVKELVSETINLNSDAIQRLLDLELVKDMELLSRRKNLAIIKIN